MGILSFQVLENPNANIFGRLGKGIGQGIADQLPKEIERQRLSSGLKKLGEQDYSSKTPLQIQADLYSIPGITPEIAQQAYQQIQNQNFINMRQRTEKPTENAMISESQVLPTEEETESGFASPEQIKQRKNKLLQEPSFEEDIKPLADDYLRSGLATNPTQALQMATQEFNQNRISQQGKLNTFTNELNERFKTELQGSGLNDYKDVAGKIQQALLDEGRDRILRGNNPAVVAQDMGDILYDLGLAANKVKDIGSWGNMFKSSKAKTNDLLQQRKAYQKYGFGELFDDMATAALGITPLEAAHNLDPIKNKKLNEGLNKFRGGPFFSDKKLDNLLRDIKPKDNLFDLLYKMRQKHVDVDKVKARIEKLVSDGEIALSKQQERQLQKPITNNLLGDILYEIF